MRVLELTSCRGGGRRTGSEYTDIQSPHRCFCSCHFHRGIKNKLRLLNKQKLRVAAVNDFLVEMIVGSHCSPCFCVDMHYQHNSLVNKILVFLSFLKKKDAREPVLLLRHKHAAQSTLEDCRNTRGHKIMNF